MKCICLIQLGGPVFRYYHVVPRRRGLVNSVKSTQVIFGTRPHYYDLTNLTIKVWKIKNSYQPYLTLSAWEGGGWLGIL